MKGDFFLALNPLMASSLAVTTRGCPLPDVGGQTGRTDVLLRQRTDVWGFVFFLNLVKVFPKIAFLIPVFRFLI